jgi:hypothetical protein
MRMVPLLFTCALAITRFRRFCRWCIPTMTSGSGCTVSRAAGGLAQFADDGTVLGSTVTGRASICSWDGLAAGSAPGCLSWPWLRLGPDTESS